MTLFPDRMDIAMLAEIQVSPRPSGTAENTYANVDAAIAVISASGLTYEVGPLGTTIEGPAAQVWDLLRRVHDAALAAGAESCGTVIKIADSPSAQPTIAGLVTKHR